MDEIKVTNDSEVREEAPVVEAAPAESMEDYKTELNASMRQIKQGDIVEGTVIGVSESEVTVDLQYYAEGVILPQDYSGDPKFSIKEDVQVGEKVQAKVIRLDDGHGNIQLSRKAAADELAWADFKRAMDEKKAVDVKVSEAVKGGVVTYLNGIRAFIPASKLSTDYVEDLTTYVGQVVPAYIIQAEKEGRKLVLSVRDVLRDRKAAEKAEMVNNLKVGLVTEGTVQTLQSYGAFVSLGKGIDGLVHISQISGGKRLKHPSEVLSVGDKVKVKVIAVKDGKISLSMKALDEPAEKEKAPVAVEEEKVVIPKSEKLTTSLGDLLKGIKLD